MFSSAGKKNLTGLASLAAESDTERGEPRILKEDSALMLAERGRDERQVHSRLRGDASRRPRRLLQREGRKKTRQSGGAAVISLVLALRFTSSKVNVRYFGAYITAGRRKTAPRSGGGRLTAAL